MAWYDNLQYPDYAKHYENQGKIYSDLLNSLSKIGGEYLQKQREDVARKNMPTPEQYTTNFPEIKGINPKMASPAIPELYAPSGYRQQGGLPPDIIQRGQGALNAIEGTKGSPARTEFDQTGYINALAKLMTGGNLEERNAAKDAYTVFGMQEQARKAGLPTYESVDSEKDLYEKNPYTNKLTLLREGTKQLKGEYFYDKNGNQPPLFIEYGGRQPVPEGYISKAQLQETGKNTRQEEGIIAKINAASTSDDFKKNQNQLDRNHETTLTNLKESGIQGRANILTQLSKRSQLVREVNAIIPYSSSYVEKLKTLQNEINDINNFLAAESKKNQTSGKSGKKSGL
jgi:hypothetical protein